MNHPKRDSFFANRFIGALREATVANELGVEVCWLLTMIVIAEQSANYSGPVQFWDLDMMTAAGCRSPQKLSATRQRAIDARWLSFQRHETARAGSYAVTVPPQYEEFFEVAEAPLV